MNALASLLNLPESERANRGLTHTPREIAQQPDTWLSTFEIFKNVLPDITTFLASMGTPLTIFLIGAGTSDYIGRSLTHLFRCLWGCEVMAVPSTDLLTHMDEWIIPGRKYLWISFSRSGNSPEGVTVLQRAIERHPDVRHILITCNANGRMIHDSADKEQVFSMCLDDSVNDRGLAMTSSFSNMAILGQCLAHASDLSSYERILLQLVKAGRGFLPAAADCAAVLAKDGYSKACFVGSGMLNAIAVESALKLVELTAGKTLAVSESALGLRHGPLAALDQGTLFVCLYSGNSRVQKYEQELLEEIGNKRLVKTRVVVATCASVAQDVTAEEFVTPETSLNVDDHYRVLDVLFGQLLGLFFSLRWNLLPDSPSPTGAISRVVHDFTIHA